MATWLLLRLFFFVAILLFLTPFFIFFILTRIVFVLWTNSSVFVWDYDLFCSNSMLDVAFNAAAAGATGVLLGNSRGKWGECDCWYFLFVGTFVVGVYCHFF